MRKRKNKRPNKGTWLIIFLIFGYFIFNFGAAEVQLLQLGNQKEILETQLAKEKDKSQQLSQELDQIDSDEYIETLARKYFGLVYPQEKIIIEVEPDNSKN